MCFPTEKYITTLSVWESWREKGNFSIASNLLAYCNFNDHRYLCFSGREMVKQNVFKEIQVNLQFSFHKSVNFQRESS